MLVIYQSLPSFLSQVKIIHANICIWNSPYANFLGTTSISIYIGKLILGLRENHKGEAKQIRRYFSFDCFPRAALANRTFCEGGKFSICAVLFSR